MLLLHKPRPSRLPREAKSKVASADVVATEAVPPWDMRVSTIQTVTTGPAGVLREFIILACEPVNAWVVVTCISLP